MSAEHVVETLHWDVAFASEDEAFEWQPRLAALLRGPAVTLINEVFDELAVRGEVLALDTLEIDLGALPRDGLEHALSDRLRARLREALLAQWAGARVGQAPTDTVRPRGATDAALLRHYLERGFLPWQAGDGLQRRLADLAGAAANGDDLAAWLRSAPTAATARLAQLLHPRIALARVRVEAALLAQSPLTAQAREGWRQLVLCDPAALIDLVARHGQAARVRRRMASDFDATLLLELVGLLVPTERDFIAGVTGQAPVFAAALQPPPTQDRMRSRLWEFTLAYLLVDRGSGFNRRSYIASLLERSAQHDGIDEGQLLQSLIRALAAAGSSALQRQMLELLHAIAQGEQLRAARHVRRTAASRDWIAHCDGHRRRIEAVLRSDAPIGDEVRAAWTLLADDDGAWLAGEVSRAGQSARVRRRMARDFDAPMLLRLVRLLVPTEHDFIAAVTGASALFAQAVDPPIAEARVRTRLWDFTLAYLLARRGSEFNRRSYIATLLRRWAQEDGIDHRELLRSITAGLSSAAAGAMQRQMLALLLDLQGEPAPPPSTERERALPQLRLVWQAALASGAVRAGETWSAWEALSRHDSGWLREETRRGLQSPRTREQLAACESLRLVRIVELFASGNGEFVEAVIGQAAPLARSSAPHSARSRLWDFTLVFLTADRGSEFNRRSYLAAALGQLARSEGMALRDLLSSLMTSLQAAAPASGMQRQLLQFAGWLLAECDPRATHDASPDIDAGTAWHDDLRSLLDARDRGVRASLERALRSPQGVDRLATRLPARLLTRIVFALRPREHDAIEQAGRQMVLACATLRLAAPALLEELRWQFTLRYLFVEGRRFSAADFARRFAAWLEQRLRVKDAGTWRASVARELAKSPRSAGQAVGRATAVALASPPARAREAARENERRPGAEPRPGEPIYVANAGLVLAQPFLPRLFTMRGLMHEGAFRDPAAAARAVALSQWLATGCNEFGEHEVVLNKLLCGLPVAEPLAWQGDPDDADRAAATSLLEAIVQQWKALGTTSAQGLRDTFLRREGRLLLQDDAWQLLVQPGPYDMLVDAIPWGFGLIKYPWMERMLHVQWR